MGISGRRNVGARPEMRSRGRSLVVRASVGCEAAHVLLVLGLCVRCVRVLAAVAQACISLAMCARAMGLCLLIVSQSGVHRSCGHMELMAHIGTL